jgi:glycine oxidase
MRRSKERHVVIVGGGIMGCAAAYELCRRGVPVTVLERAVPGAEASSAAAGILGAQVEAHAPGPLSELGLRSRALFPGLVRALERDAAVQIEYRRCGVLKVAFTKQQLQALRRQHAWQARAGLPLQELGRKQLWELEPALSKSALGALRFEDDAVVDPRALLRALRIAAERRGVKFRSGCVVQRIEEEAGRASGVELDDGSSVRASHVVLAAGSWTSLLWPEARGGPRIVPARGQMIEIATSVPLVAAILFGPDCYCVPRADGRLLIGSTLEFVGFRRGVTAGAVARLLAAAIQLLPAAADAELCSTWSSFRPYTIDELPLLGPSRLPGLIVMSGHYRNGILLAPISARIVRNAVLGERPSLSLEPFRPERVL